jgi:hypothetical protein
MSTEETVVLEELLVPSIRRRKLLPLWIKIFTWFFLICGLFTLIVIIIGMAGYEGNLSLYGLHTSDPLSITGIIIAAFFLLKGITAYALWTEMDWAVSLAIVDAIIGIAVCIFLMAAPAFFPSVNFELRLELALLIPYLNKLQKIKERWQHAGKGK